MGPLAKACLALALGCAMSGCGTVVNCMSSNGVAPREIYGGVKQDAQNGTTHLIEAFTGPAPSFTEIPKPPNAARDFASKSFCGCCGVAMLAVDLPISAVTDTLTLPLTVPAALLKKEKRKPKHKPKAVGMPSSAMPTSSGAGK